MTPSQLEILVRVADLQSFTAAAVQLGITQSAVSHAVAALEREWGVVLLTRSPSGIAPTAIGRQLLVRVRELLGVNEAIRQEVAAARGLASGMLRIGSFGPSASLRLLPALLDVFRRRYPQIEVGIDEGTDEAVLGWIAERRVDLGFVVLPVPHFETLPLVTDQLMALLPAADPLAGLAALPAARLCERPFILTAAGSGNLIERRFAAEGLRPQVRHRFSQILTILDMVARGEGVSVVAELALPSVLPPGVVARPFAPAATRRIGLAVRDLAQASPAARAFLAQARLQAPALAGSAAVTAPAGGQIMAHHG